MLVYRSNRSSKRAVFSLIQLVSTEKCSFRSLNEVTDPFWGSVVRISKLGLKASDSRDSPLWGHSLYQEGVPQKLRNVRSKDIFQWRPVSHNNDIDYTVSDTYICESLADSRTCADTDICIDSIRGRVVRDNTDDQGNAFGSQKSNRGRNVRRCGI